MAILNLIHDSLNNAKNFIEIVQIQVLRSFHYAHIALNFSWNS